VGIGGLQGEQQVRRTGLKTKSEKRDRKKQSDKARTYGKVLCGESEHLTLHPVLRGGLVAGRAAGV
jgi:hypothetical protein